MTNENKKAYGIIGVLVILLGIGLGYYWHISQTAEEETPTENAAETEAVTTQPADQPPADTPAPQPAADTQAWSSLVKEKDDIDVGIGEVANSINAYLNRHASFADATGLKNRANALVTRAANGEAQANQLTGIAPDKKAALAKLFSLERQRAQGLYKGMVDNTNGGDYSLGFQSGTKASYAFDEANKAFQPNL